MKSLAQLMDLHGSVALITGGTGMIGRTLAGTLAELGGEIILVDRPGSQFAELEEQLRRDHSCRARSRACDLEQGAARAEVIKWLGAEVGRLDILVNNAAFVGESGLSGWVTAFPEQSVDTWRRALEVNLTAIFELTQGVAPMLAAGKGSVINIASIYGVAGPDLRLYEGTAMGNPAAYAASKGGLIQLSRWLATVLAPAVRVNVISPGGVARNQPDAFVRRYVERTPLARMATEEDFKGVVAFLATDLSAYVTGQNIIVDGGWTVW